MKHTEMSILDVDGEWSTIEGTGLEVDFPSPGIVRIQNDGELVMYLNNVGWQVIVPKIVNNG